MKIERRNGYNRRFVEQKHAICAGRWHVNELSDTFEILLIDLTGVTKNFAITVKGEQFQCSIYRKIAAIEEALFIGNVIVMIRSHHGEPLNAVADLFAAAFGEKVISGIAGDSDDFCMDTGFVLNTPEGNIVGTVVIANDALGHDPVASVAHQQKDVIAGKNNAAGAASDCSCQG